MDKVLDEELKHLERLEVEDCIVRELKRRMVLECALELSEKILLDYSDDDAELNWYTVRIAEIYMGKISIRANSTLLAQDFKGDLERQRK